MLPPLVEFFKPHLSPTIRLSTMCEFIPINFPDVPISASAAIGAKKPNRLFYPSTELGSNEANVTAQGVIDVFSTKIFWDVD